MLRQRNSLFRKDVITSALDNDFYKVNMGQCIMHQFPYIEDAHYRLKIRSKIDLRPYRVEIMREIEKLDGLRYTNDQVNFLSQKPWYTKDYLEHLRSWQYQTRFITVTEEDGQLCIDARGPVMHVKDFEIPVLAIVSEVAHRNLFPNAKYEDVRKPLYEKIEYLRKMHREHDLTGLQFSDFSTRRRFSYETQFVVVETLLKEVPEFFAGTSNMHLAKEFGINTIGTMAHEIFMLAQQIDVQLRNSQKFTLEAWVKEFRGQLGYALTDVIGMDAFIKDFDLYFAKLFDGLRHDSGDPFVFGDKAIQMYKNLKIDPRTKQLTFSNSVNFTKMIELFLHFRPYIRTNYGIGKFLGNDVAGTTQFDSVMKLISVNGKPVAKISDDPGKGMCKDEAFVQYLRKEFNVTW